MEAVYLSATVLSSNTPTQTHAPVSFLNTVAIWLRTHKARLSLICVTFPEYTERRQDVGDDKLQWN